MKLEEFVSQYPRLYHMSEDGSWESIRFHGLLSTSALLDLFEVNGKEREDIENCIRPESVTINHPKYGTAVIRDQKPLRESTLSKLLDGMSVAQYCKLLNGKTFFWVDEERLKRLLSARAYRNKAQTVLTLDSGSLLKIYEDRVYLSRINSGAAIYGNGRRGINTFQKLRKYPFKEMKRKYRENAIVELAVDYSVNDVEKFTILAERWSCGKPVEILWRKSKEK